MSKNVNETNQVNEQKGKRRTITTIGYALMIVFLVIVLPVVLPLIFGYHTHTVGADATGELSGGSLVYLKEMDGTAYTEGNIVAVQENESGRDVDVYYVDSNDTSAQTLEVRGGNTVSYDAVAGHVVAKTPFIGYLSQLCFSVVGIIVTVVIFVAGLGCMMYANKISKEVNQELEDENN